MSSLLHQMIHFFPSTPSVLCHTARLDLSLTFLSIFLSLSPSSPKSRETGLVDTEPSSGDHSLIRIVQTNVRSEWTILWKNQRLPLRSPKPCVWWVWSTSETHPSIFKRNFLIQHSVSHLSPSSIISSKPWIINFKKALWIIYILLLRIA